MKKTKTIPDEETFSRWVYIPRFMSVDGTLNSRFIILREPLMEKGISGQLYDRLERQQVIKDALQFVRKKKDGTDAEILKYIAKARIGDIRAIALAGDKIDVIEAPSEKVTSHAEIVFELNGKRVDGTCKDAKLLMYYDDLRDLFSKNMSEITAEELKAATGKNN